MKNYLDSTIKIWGPILVIAVSCLPIWIMYEAIQSCGFCKEILPILLFSLAWILLDLIILSIMLCDDKESLSSIVETLRTILYTIIAILALLAVFRMPFKAVYNCEHYECTEIIYSMTTVSTPLKIEIFGDTEKIGMNDFKNLNSNTEIGKLSRPFVLLGYIHDQNNLEKLKNSNGEILNLYSYCANGLIGVILCLSLAFLLFPFNLKGSNIYIGLIITSIILARLLYIIFFI